MKAHTFIAMALIAGLLGACAKKTIQTKAPLEHMQAQLDKLAPVTLEFDMSSLTENDQAVLKKLVQAARYMDEIFLRQVSEKNVQYAKELKALEGTPEQAYLDYFRINFGPWDRLHEDEPFINEEPKPKSATFYPAKMKKEEFTQWVADHPEDKADFEQYFTVIRWATGGLKAVPYSEVYAEQLAPAAKLLEEAAAITGDSTLARFLRSRAGAFRSNDYFQSDMDWMDLAGNIDIVIGPYEVYEDRLFGYKAAFESFVTVVDQEESAKLATVAAYLDEMEENLPIPSKYKNFGRGKESPIKVVNEVFTAGDTKAGIQTTAFNLPNDERVREAKGSKKVMLKNVARAKFDQCWVPIVNTVLDGAELENVSFDAYFNHVLMHEMSHGLGPGNITMEDGAETSVNAALKELYSTIEECKADVLGIYNLQFAIDKRVFPKELERQMYSSYLGGMFRSIRFGIGEAHGGGVAIQYNFLKERGAIKVDDEGMFSADRRKMERGITELAQKLLMIQALGDYEGAAALIEKYRVITPELKSALDSLKDVPVDIRPVYPIEELL